jgi:hypothetical protein
MAIEYFLAISFWPIFIGIMISGILEMILRFKKQNTLIKNFIKKIIFFTWGAIFVIIIFVLYLSTINVANKLFIHYNVNEKTVLYVIIEPDFCNHPNLKYKITDKNIISKLIEGIRKSRRAPKYLVLRPGRMKFYLTNGEVITFLFDYSYDGRDEIETFDCLIPDSIIGEFSDHKASKELKEIYQEIITKGIGKIGEEQNERKK